MGVGIQDAINVPVLLWRLFCDVSCPCYVTALIVFTCVYYGSIYLIAELASSISSALSVATYSSTVQCEL